MGRVDYVMIMGMVPMVIVILICAVVALLAVALPCFAEWIHRGEAVEFDELERVCSRVILYCAFVAVALSVTCLLGFAAMVVARIGELI